MRRVHLLHRMSAELPALALGWLRLVAPGLACLHVGALLLTTVIRFAKIGPFWAPRWAEGKLIF